MYLGKIVESAPVREIFHAPKHPYTQGLMNSIPSLADSGAKRLKAIEGVVPSSTAPRKGCGFAPRCPHAMPVCRERSPELLDVTPGHSAACFLHQAVT
jgi:peptide/nickel transport system ATP-binding protein